MPAAEHTEPTTLDTALNYARRGWRVIPIPPGEKFPRGITAWQTEGSTDEAKIAHWWTNAPDHGIGIVTGATSGLWVLDVDVAGDKVGDETLAELEAAYGDLPPTYEVITGSGGRHLYFAWPDGQTITNSASGRLGPGLDVRGEGGFVVAPPSLHANGRRYIQEASSPDHVAIAPAWLVGMLEAPEPTPAPRQAPSTATGDRPGDLWAAQTTWAQILEPDGWTLHHVSADGEEHWTRPGKERRDGTSATTGYLGSDVLKVFTSSHPTLNADETYTKIGYLAATRHHGDHSAAAAALRNDGWKAPDTGLAGLLAPGMTAGAGVQPAEPTEAQEATMADQRADWAPIDLTAILNGNHHPPEPTILTPHGTMPLIYPERVNMVFGESGAGKTWVAFAAVVEVLEAGGVTVFIDLEDNAHGATSRLIALGVDHDAILDRFIYLAPQTGWGPVAQASVAALIDARGPELVILDSTGEAMAASGVKGNDDDDVARWFVTFPKFIARRGPAVIIIDHVPKDPNAPIKYAIGSQRKTAAIDGAAYRVDAVKAPSKTADGLLKITTAKDRNGTRSQGEVAAMAALSHDLMGGVRLALTAPDTLPRDPAGKPRFTVYMERVSRVLEATPGLNTRELESRTEGKAKLIREATRTLIEEGYIDQMPAARGFAFEVITPYREHDDPTAVHGVSGEAVTSVSPVSPPGTPCPTPPGSGAESSVSPAPPPTGQGHARGPTNDHQIEASVSLVGGHAEMVQHHPTSVPVDNPPAPLKLDVPEGSLLA